MLYVTSMCPMRLWVAKNNLFILLITYSFVAATMVPKFGSCK